MTPRDLPIYTIEDELRRAVTAHPTVVVESPPGSGKTTQIPQILHSAGLTELGVIGVTQPRRIAAVSVSARIAEEMGCQVGGLVGYKMRFYDRTSLDTRLKIMTDGILLQELRNDPLLSRYAMIMVDEAHERSLNIDFILGLLKQIQRTRRDLRVLVSSATMNAEAFCRYFDDAPLLRLDVRPHPVTLRYLKEDLPWGPQPLLDASVEAVASVLRDLPEGDVLVFLPGERAILDCVDRVRALPVGGLPLQLLPLFGRLPKEEQDRVFDVFPGRRKVIVATNIAETSITIDGVRAVVDCGFAKVKSFRHTTGIGVLEEQPISRASCDQRAGRAGRTAPGLCVRLFAERSYGERPRFGVEEIRRTDLAEVVLRMLALDIRDVEDFEFLTPPPPGAVGAALALLQDLGAATRDLRLTEVGERMIELPLEPRIGRMVVEAALRVPQVLDEVVTIASFLSARTPFATIADRESESRAAHRVLADPRGDLHTFLRIFRMFEEARDPEAMCRERFLDERVLGEVANIRGQLLELVERQGVRPQPGGRTAEVIATVATGLGQLICRRDSRGNGYHSLTTGRIFLHPGSALFRQPPECFVAAEIVRTRRTFARSAARMEPEWVAEAAPDVYAALFPGRRTSSRRSAAPRMREAPPSSLSLAGRSFPVREVRNQLLVSLPWEEARLLDPASALADAPETRGWRGQLLLAKGVLQRGQPLRAILETLPLLRIDEGLLRRWPREDFFSVPGSEQKLLRFLPDLLRVVPVGGRRRSLGFLTLCANGDSGYWYDASPGYRDAQATSLAALEELRDDLATLEMHEEAAAVERHAGALRT